MQNRKGFTLVEMAIVLVIIGVIIGAVVKGQDLITNAQAKQVASTVSSWRNLAYAYLDRNGRLPGDSVRNGVIGDVAAEQTPATTGTGELVNVMNYAPENPVIVGSMQFWVYFGNTSVTVGTRNAMLICGSVDCATPFSLDQLEIIKSLDAAYDGTADGGLGQFRAVTAAPTLTAGGTGSQGTPSRATAVFTGAGVAPVSLTTNGATTVWATTHRAAVWLFDRTF